MLSSPSAIKSAVKPVRQSEHKRALSKQSYDNQLDHLKQVKITQVTMGVLIQFKAAMANLKDLISEIAKVTENIHEPTTYAQIIHYPVHCCQWELAIDKELNLLLAMSTFKLCKLSLSRRLITSKWVFKVKYTLSGLVNQFKAYLVAHEFMQIEDIDFDETFASILWFESLHLLLFLIIQHNLQIQQMNMNNMYLADDLNEDIYMKILKEYSLSKDHCGESPALRLLKSLYSLKQSEHIWNKKFKAALIFMSFKSISTDNCVFVNYDTGVMISLYINNLLLFARKLSAIDNTKWLLKRHFKMKDLDEPDMILGIQIKQERDWISINQSVYIKAFLKEYDLKNCKAVVTFIDDYETLTSSTDSESQTNQQVY